MWGSREQKLMAMSMTKAEYIAFAAAAQNLSVIKTICFELGLMHDVPCTLKTDNLAVRGILAKPHATKRRKFIDLRHQLLQYTIAKNRIQVQHVRSWQQKADMFTKSLQRVMFQRQCTMLQNQSAAPDGGSDAD